MIGKVLLYPPLRQTIKKTPDLIIYPRKIYSKSEEVAEKYTMIKDGEVVGYMIGWPKLITRNGKETPSFYIWNLISHVKRQGYGKKFLDFAQIISREKGCEGNLHLDSSGFQTPYEVPHIFYRKYGMNTGNKCYDKKLDKCIEYGESATVNDFPEIKMYYPPVDYPETPKVKGFWKNLANWLFS